MSLYSDAERGKVRFRKNNKTAVCFIFIELIFFPRHLLIFYFLFFFLHALHSVNHCRLQAMLPWGRPHHAHCENIIYLLPCEKKEALDTCFRLGFYGAVNLSAVLGLDLQGRCWVSLHKIRGPKKNLTFFKSEHSIFMLQFFSVNVKLSFWLDDFFSSEFIDLFWKSEKWAAHIYSRNICSLQYHKFVSVWHVSNS